uniref:Uncharacterized protein n=1 Tax=Asterionellopsis glacialis TaxID=33640 RepID=A0A7S0KY39_9STRA|mmetsp:Transcript_1870/g.2714  ORF Transcript_1870/g.2714 Transcript_1870/m.2714 type:complete len:316 (+) Transcript_1870:200-1147(+)
MKCVTIRRDGQSVPPPTTIPAVPAAYTSSRASSRKNRVFVFRDFLRKTYGDDEYLFSNDSCVLDVAGGKGDLSWLLVNVDGLDSIVADPRLTNHAHLIKSVDFLLQHPEEAAARAIPNRPTHQPLATLIPKLSKKNGSFQVPRHLRLFVDSELVDAVRETLESNSTTKNHNNMDMTKWQVYWSRSITRGKQATTLGYQESGHSPSQISDSLVAWQTIRSLRLIVGFHPDQATEACIDLAILLGIPFCVCPCCVFPTEFPDRQLTNGEGVRTHADFIKYLCQKHPSVLTSTLNFHNTKTAKNTVLYTAPADMNPSR